jgi:hypothetical protein
MDPISARRQGKRCGNPIALAFLCLLLPAEATSGDNPEAPGPKNWPTTVEQAVQDILPRLTTADRSAIKAMRKDELIRLHFSLGMDIRNRDGLWSGNESLLVSACGQPCHPDAASMKIIEALWLRLKQ